MKTAQEFREIAIKKMSTPDMVEAAGKIESLIYVAINKGENYISLNTGSVTYRYLCDLTKGYDNLKTYLELHGYTVSTSGFDGSSFFTVSF
jgi:hypothetical protein